MGYTLKTFEDSTWVEGQKDGEFFCIAMDKDSVLQAIWREEGANPKVIYKAYENGEVYEDVPLDEIL